MIQASTEIDLEDAAVARKRPEDSTDRELVARPVDQALAGGMELVGRAGCQALLLRSPRLSQLLVTHARTASMPGRRR